jgi:hypothetical protein
MALLFAQCFGYGAVATGLVSSTSPAYTLVTGALGVQEGAWFDAEIGLPDTGGTMHFQDYHSCKIVKAEWVIERSGIATYSYDVDAAYVSFPSSSAITGAPTQPTAPVPFSPTNASSLFKVWDGAALSTLDGCRKTTVTLTPKLATDRIYLGNVYKDEPSTIGLIEVAVALEMDYTPTAASDIFKYFVAPNRASLGNNNTTDAFVVSCAGNQIAVGINDLVKWTFPELWIMSGGEAPLDGVDIVKNTIMLKGVLDANGDGAAYGVLDTLDSSY